MNLESASSIQKVESDDSIVACQQDAPDFFDSIDPTRTCGNVPHDRSFERHSLPEPVISMEG